MEVDGILIRQVHGFGGAFPALVFIEDLLCADLVVIAYGCFEQGHRAPGFRIEHVSTNKPFLKVVSDVESAVCCFGVILALRHERRIQFHSF